MEFLTYLTSLAAFGGLALGGYNSWRNWKLSNVCLQILPNLHIFCENSWKTLYCSNLSTISEEFSKEFFEKGIFGITVINKSQFPIYISEIGFAHGKNLYNRSAISKCAMITGIENNKTLYEIYPGIKTISFPFELKSREALTLAMITFFDNNAYKATHDSLLSGVYVRTVCQHVVYAECKKLIESRYKTSLEVPIENFYPQISQTLFNKTTNNLNIETKKNRDCDR